MLFEKILGEISLWERLKNSDKPVVLYGTGNGADRVLDECERLGIKISGIFASGGFVRSRTFRGFPVKSYEAIQNEFQDFIVVVAFGSSRPEVIENILKIASEKELFYADVPVYGDEIFSRDFVKKYGRRLEFVYDNLADEKSRDTFQNLCLAKFTGDIKYLFAAEADISERAEITRIAECENILDIGAYTGDTAAEFVRLCPQLKKITAVEPDARNFRKLCENTKDIPQIIPVNAYVTDFCGEIKISKSRGRGVSEGGDVTQKAVTADSLLCGEKTDFIKIDAEGAELSVITGASETIKKYAPVLNVSVYHKTEDYFVLPEKILSLYDGYKMYIRHYKYIPAWDTELYFIKGDSNENS